MSQSQAKFDYFGYFKKLSADLISKSGSLSPQDLYDLDHDFISNNQIFSINENTSESELLDDQDIIKIVSKLNAFCSNCLNGQKYTFEQLIDHSVFKNVHFIIYSSIKCSLIHIKSEQQKNMADTNLKSLNDLFNAIETFVDYLIQLPESSKHLKFENIDCVNSMG